MTTNNVAEYQGWLAALRSALGRGHNVVFIRSHSELLVWRAKNERG